MAPKNQTSPDGNHRGIDYVVDMVEKRLDKLDAKSDKHSEDIAFLTAIVRNGLTHKIEVMDRRWWAVAGGILLLAVGMVANILLIYG